ncbi:MAG: DUF1064 domain-containing protein [Candidatus Thiodiazotropha endolucinida]
MRFKSRNHGMNARKHIWLCFDCKSTWTTKSKKCPQCGSQRFQYFPSTAEYKRYCQLRLMQNMGEISNLELQPSYPCVIEGKKVTTYRADFKYSNSNGASVVEDVKGDETDVFKLKRKLVEALYGITIKIVRA